MARIADIRQIEVPARTRDGGTLVAWQQPDAPFAVARVFTVSAPANAVRGDHAHKRCAQLLVSAAGNIRIDCYDGTERKGFLLDAPNKGLLVPPGIFATETYLGDGALLMVLCDQPYDETDYLRGEDKFRAWIAAEQN
jgi:dTDP-4-dehydrorhamnose 3,5-epimerase-like enzyme